jgi:microcystin degradation protein MlrC
MAIVIGSIVQETNTFSPVKTRYADLTPVFGSAAIELHDGRRTEMGGFLHQLRRSRADVEPLCAAWGITANRVVADDFRRLRDEVLRRLKRVRRTDAVLLAMHGAQCAEGVDDVEGHLLTMVREIVGPRVPIVVTLDLHANVTQAMVRNATAIVGYRTYPHVDMFETGVRAARLLRRILAGGLQPVMVLHKLPLIVPAENMQTAHGPFHRLIRRAQQMERSRRAVAVSVFGVQPWLDVQEMGCSVVAVTNADLDAAVGCAEELARQFWKSRRQFSVRLTPVRKAIRRALATPGGPVVLSESSDSTGSGSPGDSTGVLRPLLESAVTEPCAAYLVDREGVAAAVRAGVGRTIRIRIGGKIDRRHSKPVRVQARVRLISDGRWTPKGAGYNSGVEVQMGLSTVIDVGAVRILMSERPAMTVDPELYRSHGIEPRHMKIVVVKSPNGFRAEYEPIARKIFIVDTPGVSTPNLKSLPFRRVPRPIYPLDEHVR